MTCCAVPLMTLLAKKDEWTDCVVNPAQTKPMKSQWVGLNIQTPCIFPGCQIQMTW